jgi:hypothetical protein
MASDGLNVNDFCGNYSGLWSNKTRAGLEPSLVVLGVIIGF